MEWLMVNNPQIHNCFRSLGSFDGITYIVNPNCLEILNEILQKISVEDRTLRTLRRSIGFSQVVQKDLLPLFINVCNDQKITETVIKILANLTTPVECLLPIEVMSKTDAGRNTIIELNWLLLTCKRMFLDSRVTKRITDHIKKIIYKDQLSETDCETLNDCIILIRNILQIPDSRPNSEGISEQNQIIWNLFAQNIDKVLFEMISDEKRSTWRMAIAQLIVLLYRDQRISTLQKLLSLWFEAAELSESSEDNESNTSPPEGDCSSSMVTSDPTSDSSDNGGSDTKMETVTSLSKLPGKRKPLTKPQPTKKADEKQSCRTMGGDQKMEVGSSEVSDCGYGSLAGNQESISTSSNEDDAPNRGMKPVHQKPTNMIQKSRYSNGKTCTTNQEKTEMRRKKLTRRSRTNMVNMKALLHHTPTDDDISQLLKEFTVDFLLKGYATMVAELRGHLLTSTESILDKAPFFWLVAYFLKFAVQLELDLQLISPVLSYEVISYITYEGVSHCEEFELTRLHSESDLSPCLFKIHLIVTAIREMIHAINGYKKIKHLKEKERDYLNQLQKEVSQSEDLRCLFVLLLRQFNPTIHNKQYLEDVIVTNHILLTFVENSSIPFSNDLLQEHMKQFVAVDMMRQYGHLLASFQDNGQFVNDCVFTMFHHVAGDLENVAALFQPIILKTFSVIWETDFQLCDDWLDLIEFVIHKFINTPRSVPAIYQNNEFRSVTLAVGLEAEWSQEDCDNLYWYFEQNVSKVDPVGSVLDLYAENGITNKTRIGVIDQLLKQDVITGHQYNELMKKEPISKVMSLDKKTQKDEVQSQDEIRLLTDHLLKKDKKHFVTWLQKVLLETCYAKLNLKKSASNHVSEPVPYYSSLLETAVPMVAWSCEQRCEMQSQVFLLLLHKLGLHLPADAGKIFARIPASWSPKKLWSIAARLGPLRRDWDKVKNIAESWDEDN